MKHVNPPFVTSGHCIFVDGKLVALRPVAVEAMDYAMREYGATAAEL